jgi:hypothetical protein
MTGAGDLASVADHASAIIAYMEKKFPKYGVSLDLYPSEQPPTTPKADEPRGGSCIVL